MPLTAQDRQPPNSAVQKSERARTLIARRLLPFLFVLYVANYLDRANLAYAALGMTQALRLSDKVFGAAAGVFFFSYLVLQIPGALLVERWSARKLIAITMVSWGSLTILTAWVGSANQLYFARFLLGAAESAFFPGVIVYLSHWFAYQDRAKAAANFAAAIPVSFMIGSPLAGLLLGVRWLHIDGWRWLFVLEGFPAVILGIIAYSYLTDRPHQAAWLPPAEKNWIVDTLDEEHQQKQETRSLTVWQALRFAPVLILAASLFFDYTAVYSFMFWFPTMLKRISGMSDLNVGFLGAIPYTVGLIGMQIIAWNSDRTQKRKLHFAGTQFLGAIGVLSVLAVTNSVTIWMILFALVGITVCAQLPCFWALPGAFLSESAAAAAVGFINAVGSIGGFVGPYVMGYLRMKTGSFTAGLIFMVISFTLSGTLILFCPRDRLAHRAS